MGLFSTLLHNTTASALSSPDPTVVAVSGTKSSTTTSTTPTKTSSSSEISSSSNNTAIPTIIQLYTKHPIPFVAVDTSIVANDILAFHHFYNNDASSSSAGSTTKSQWMKKFQNNTNLNTWLTTATATLSSFAPLQYFAVQCIPHADYGSSNEKVPFHTTMVSSSNATADATTMATTAAATTTTTVPTLRNSNTSKKQWYDMATKYLTPDLGIYQCQVALSSSSSSLTDAILPTVLSSTTNSTANSTSPVFCMVVDMSSPSQYNNVETTVTTIQQALIRFLIRHADSFRMSYPNANRHSGTTGSSTTVTSLQQLKNVTFGLANDDTTTTMTTSTTTKDTTTLDDTTIGIILQIGVIFEHHSSFDESKNASNPSSSSTTSATPLDYATQQQQHLLMYHLRKYAAALNATLLFINTDLSTSSSSFSNLETTVAATNVETTNTTVMQQQQQPTVHVREIPWLWKALANHEPIWNYDSIEAMETGNWNPSRTATIESTGTADGPANHDSRHHNEIYSYIYGPENHNVEWIESVLVRNANYPGHWDATKDSIWNVLPPTTTTSTTIATTTTTTSSHEPPGDQLWLKELYDSIVPVMSSSNNSTSATTTTPTTSSSTSSQLQTPPPTHKSGSGPTQPSTQHSKTKTPNDAAVSSFFEDLLK